MEKSETTEGHMYRVINNEVTEIRRWGDRLLPIYHPLLKEIVGQQVLFEGEE